MLPRRLSLALSILALASCAAPAPQVPPAPRPIVAAPRPAPEPTATSSDWRDWPLTPGDWRYAVNASGSTASFGMNGGAPALVLACDRATRQVTVMRPGAAGSDLTIRTSTTLRTLPTRGLADGGATAVLSGADPLLDAMGFSRGRFVVQQPGASTLIIPAWAEIGRVTEDCRG